MSGHQSRAEQRRACRKAARGPKSVGSPYELADDPGFARAFDRAIRTRYIARYLDIIIVPDVIVDTARAIGEDLPRSWRVYRDDGRSVELFRLPAGGAK
jgi:hypothetical protein